MSDASRAEVEAAVTHGIDGTDMPAHAIDGAELEALLDYVMALRDQRVQ